MRKFLAYALCTAGMIGVYFAVVFLINGISRDFGRGYFAGLATMAVLFWLNERIDRRARR